MRVILSLLLMIAGGVAYIVMPEPFFGIPKNETHGIPLLWASTLQVFAIPLVFILLSFTKNVFVKACILAWSAWALLVTTLFYFRVREYAPGVTPYGKTFLSSLLIVSLSVFVFSAIEFSPQKRKSLGGEDAPVNPS